MRTRSPAALAVLALATGLRSCASEREPPQIPTESIAALTGWDDPEARLQHESHAARLASVRQLAAIDDDAVIPALTQAVSDVDFRVRRDAIEGLGRRGAAAASAVPAIERALDDESAIVRSRALWALSEIGGRDAARALRARLALVDTAHTDEVLIALGGAGHASAVSDIAPYLEHSDPYVRRGALLALVRIGSRALPTLHAQLSSADPAMRCESARAIALLDDRAALDRLGHLAESDDSELVRACALGAAGRLGDPGAIARLTASLSQGTVDERSRAADALALAARPEVVEPLVASLTSFPTTDEHPNPAVRALIELGDVASPTLVARLETARGEELALVARVLATTARSEDRAALEAALERAETELARAALRDALQSLTIRGDSGSRR